MKVFFRKNNKDVVKAELQAQKEQALKVCGALAENYAKINCPVDTGRLRNSIDSKLVNDSTVAIGTDVEYAYYVHEGHWAGDTRVLGYPFLRLAITQHISEYQTIIRTTLK